MAQVLFYCLEPRFLQDVNQQKKTNCYSCLCSAYVSRGWCYKTVLPPTTHPLRKMFNIGLNYQGLLLTVTDKLELEGCYINILVIKQARLDLLKLEPKLVLLLPKQISFIVHTPDETKYPKIGLKEETHSTQIHF